MSTKFLENNHLVHIMPIAHLAAGNDLWGGSSGANINSDVMSMKNADGAVFIATIGQGGTGTGSVFICACDDTTPTTTVAVSFRYAKIQAPDTIAAVGEATSYLVSFEDDCVYVFEVDAAKIAEQGYEFVHLHATEVAPAGASEGTIAAFLTGLRYKEDDIGTQVT